MNIDFDNLEKIYREFCAKIDSALSQPESKLILDFSDMTESNSAGLALLLGLSRYAKLNNKKIGFSHLPEKLLSAAKLSDLDKILPL